LDELETVLQLYLFDFIFLGNSGKLTSAFNLFPDNTLISFDTAFWEGNRFPKSRGYVDYTTVIPDLGIEIMRFAHKRPDWWPNFVSEKFKLFKAAGTRLIWLILPEKQQIKVHRPYQTEPVAVLGMDDILDGEDVLPGFTVPVR